MQSKSVRSTQPSMQEQPRWTQHTHLHLLLHRGVLHGLLQLGSGGRVHAFEGVLCGAADHHACTTHAHGRGGSAASCVSALHAAAGQRTGGGLECERHCFAVLLVQFGRQWTCVLLTMRLVARVRVMNGSDRLNACNCFVSLQATNLKRSFLQILTISCFSGCRKSCIGFSASSTQIYSINTPCQYSSVLYPAPVAATAALRAATAVAARSPLQCCCRRFPCTASVSLETTKQNRATNTIRLHAL